jgi:hypothetical protein
MTDLAIRVAAAATLVWLGMEMRSEAWPDIRPIPDAP